MVKFGKCSSESRNSRFSKYRLSLLLSFKTPKMRFLTGARRFWGDWGPLIKSPCCVPTQNKGDFSKCRNENRKSSRDQNWFWMVVIITTHLAMNAVDGATTGAIIGCIAWVIIEVIGKLSGQFPNKHKSALKHSADSHLNHRVL